MHDSRSHPPISLQAEFFVLLVSFVVVCSDPLNHKEHEGHEEERSRGLRTGCKLWRSACHLIYPWSGAAIRSLIIVGQQAGSAVCCVLQFRPGKDL